MYKEIGKDGTFVMLSEETATVNKLQFSTELRAEEFFHLFKNLMKFTFQFTLRR